MIRLVAIALAVAIATPALAGKEFIATEEDFDCLTDWALVGKTRVFNAKKRRNRKAQRKLKRIFEKGKKAKLPKGTIIQIVPALPETER